MSNNRELSQLASLITVDDSDRSIGINTSVGIGTTNPTSKLQVQGDAFVSGVVTATTFIGALTGIAASATQLVTPRTFEITGDVVASAISFNGTGNVSLAATIQPNSVGLGTDTTGDYVRNITGTSNQITVTSGTGEGSTPTLSIPNQFTPPQDVTVTRDLQVNRNLNVNGNITIGGTSATLFTTELKIFDPDIVLGFRTDALGNDVSTDNTANHGGVALASTEGTPLVNLFIAGIETNPATYKKIMWFKSGTFTGLNTDAWLINYAVGIGSTQFPTGTRLAAGNVQFTQNDLAVVGNINASGVTTTSTLNVGTGGTIITTTAGGSVGIGTTNPVTPLHISDGNGAVSSALYTSDYLTISAQNSAPGFNIIAAGSVDTYRGVFKATRARGTLSSPTVPLVNDYTFSLLGAIYDGSTGRATAAIEMQVDGTVGVGTAPQRITFWTGTGSSRVERARITSTGNIGIGTTNPITKLHVISADPEVILVDRTSVANSLIQYRNTVGSMYAGLSVAGAAWGVGGTNNLNINPHLYILRSGGEVLIGSANSTGTATQRLQVTGGAYVSGNLGIGTTNPTAKLEPVDTAANPTVAPVVFIQRPNNILPASIAPTNADLRIKSHSSNVKIYAEDHSANPLMILTGSGNLGIGITNPLGRLQVGAAGTSVFIVDSTGGVGIGTTSTVIGIGNSFYDGTKLHVVNTIDNASTEGAYSVVIDTYMNGTQTPPATDAEQAGLLVNTRSDVTSGTTANEHQAYGIYNFLRVNGDSDLVTPAFNYGILNHTSGNITNFFGCYNVAESTATSTISAHYGTFSLAAAASGSSGTIADLVGVRARTNFNTGATATAVDIFAVWANIDNDAATTQSVSGICALYYGSYDVTTGLTNPYGVYIPTNVKNYFSGSVGIGSTNPLTKLFVNGTLGFAGGISGTSVPNVKIGDENTAISLTTGTENVFIGGYSGQNTTDGSLNVCVGSYSGQSNIESYYNTFIGYAAGQQNLTGGNNVCVGAQAGGVGTLGEFNAYVGSGAGLSNNGNYNAYLGYVAGGFGSVGDSNCFIGAYAGYFCEGNNNIAIGYNAVVPNDLGSNQLIIGNDNGNWISGNSSFGVGIGTTNPGAKLDVQGTLHIRDGTGSRTFTSPGNLAIKDDGSDPFISFHEAAGVRNAYIQSTDTSGFFVVQEDAFPLTIRTEQSQSIIFETANVEEMRITGAGLVGIGTNNPGTLLHVHEVNSGTTPLVRIQNSNATAANNAILLELFYSGDADVSGAATSAHYIRFRDQNTNPTGQISGSSATAVLYATSSDYRLKEDITPSTNGIERIMQFKPCEFTWKESQVRSEGFIAHEVQEVFPEAVVGSKDAVDEEGNMIPQMIDPAKMVVVLTAALQEAVQRIQYLESVVGIGSS